MDRVGSCFIVLDATVVDAMSSDDRLGDDGRADMTEGDEMAIGSRSSSESLMTSISSLSLCFPFSFPFADALDDCFGGTASFETFALLPDLVTLLSRARGDFCTADSKCRGDRRSGLAGAEDTGDEVVGPGGRIVCRSGEAFNGFVEVEAEVEARDCF